jgi:DNA replication and repair protein RecF
VIIRSVSLRDFRNYEREEVAIPAGLTVLHGPVGAGKTNLLEAIYLGCVGRSCRTAHDRDLVRFGAPQALVSLTSENGSEPRSLGVVIERGRTKLYRVDGVKSERPPVAGERPLVCVFMPDRLELVKGPAAGRRTHLDAYVAALWPARRQARLAYGRALAQRNALLGRIRGGGSPTSIRVWDQELARHGVALMQDRSSVLELLAPRFAARGDQLGLEAELRLRYRPRSEATAPDQLASELAARLRGDVERGFTMHGPHRDEIVLERSDRDLRRFGSQGQQRLALLALLLAERDVLADVTGSHPLLLLDDVLSELDPERRALLLELVELEGQTLVSTADPDAASPAGSLHLLHVSDGHVES